MRETMDAWPYVIAAYAIGVGGTSAMIAWALMTMRRAESRRDAARKR
ncbi:hypothetical protein MTR62_01115 [Novosphingobium sp. 1949]|uniref:Heme exporter protein D n=1 Tax=Novosphingobium organovorum TaxID=2930092 RepID=A0ABT0B8R2_9SPHN|nr:hypothetical protein [Novosphingobium organovorum]MCJ2181314.1 hypothetical protein [Novosphingobium organovorum]